tara:strand:+ start:166 stop:783 length:618 start_codon:yes stop_codon:yes gene_type:complete
MSQFRNLTYLNNNRIIYRRYSSDVPTSSYNWGWHYDDGTYGYYALFNSKAKINSYKSLKWHLLVLWYLNPILSLNDFKKLAKVVCDKQNGFTTFEVPNKILLSMINDVYMEDLEEPPKNRLRKIVFKDSTFLSTSEKLKIVGTIMGKGKTVKQDDIYEAMMYVHDHNEKITAVKLSKILKCTTRTIHRNIGEELKQEKYLLNKQL